jgi:hypothetical protein
MNIPSNCHFGTWTGERRFVLNSRGREFVTVADTPAFGTSDAPVPD